MKQIGSSTRRRTRAAFARGRAPIALLASLLGLAALGCACPGAPATAASEPAGGGTLVGQLRLVPRAGALDASEVEGDASLVDYSTPGFAVVYLEDSQPAAVTFPIALEGGPSGPRLVPQNGALGAGGQISIANHTSEGHVVSCPEAGIVARVPAGQSLSFPVHQPGPLSLFVLEQPDSMAQLFAAPGLYTVVSGTGSFELRDVPPGAHRVRTWHPRFASTARPVEVAADQVLQLQLEVGVERGDD